MDLALCELEVEALLKAARSRGLQPLQTKRAQNETPPRKRYDYQNATPPRRRYESRARSSSSCSRSPPARRSPNSVLSPHGPRAPELKRASVLRKGSEVPESSRALRLSKLLGLSKDATPEQVRVSELRGASETRAPDFREASAESCQGSTAYKGLESSTAPPSDKTSGSGTCKKPSILNKSSELKSSTAASWTSEPRRASAAPTYMLPTATSLRKQSPLKPSADGRGADCAQRPKWQLPSPKVRRTTLRHAPSKPQPPPEERTSRLKMTQSPVKGHGVALYPSALPKPIRFGDRSACDPRQVAEERKGRLREELNRRGGVGAAWQQWASLSTLQEGMGTRFDERQQAPWVLAL
jgi:hypothetical protein